ncbi:SUMO-specific isopeptidase USPL1 isoform X1 [Oenanthe melanoleuca]|uniref:SUMO-specific isopeptidase USPL1 isoform X1 n=2 Tax=Oenanthe melanoleuca TaxID=2939378 RepID=UPI0024C19F52|nr:SUMO-specific isopeptidase USPL1 isoform X1 [Oenanthe melanoleuca]
MDTQKTTNGLQVIGEGTGIGKSTLHMVGYLGKNCNPVETTAHEYCPVCKEKGQIQGLRTYRLNFQESIFLCENPQCIYPLGYKPLNSIITSAGSENHQVPSTHKKRKLGDTSDFSAVESDPKKGRTNNVLNVEHTINADSVVKGYQNSLCIPKASLHDALQNDWQNPGSQVGSCMQKVDFETTTKTNNYQESPPKSSSLKTQPLPNSEVLSTASEISLKEDKGPTNNRDLCLQWRNMHNLCWLDCILSALVHLETLKSALAEEYKDGKCLLQKLLTKYNQASLLLNTCKRSKVKDVLPKAESQLNEIRKEMFTELQPQLGCELGNMKNPVFALQQLLQADLQAENLFLHSFSWKFECIRCGYKYQDRLKKTLTTFTNVIPDWHPLNAVHTGPCNNCGNTSQRQQMILEKVPSILTLHFVEGLPHNNLEKYSFQFEEGTYQITSVVQYQTDKKHFISWSLNSDGTWLECDDLKGPYCKRRKRFEVPPSEIYIVIWEKKASHVPEELNSQFQSKNSEDLPLNNVHSNSTELHCGFDNTVCRTPAEHHKEDSVRTPEKKQQQVAEDKSIVHHGLESIADGDLVTLMLEEVPVDSEDKLLPNGRMVGNNLLDGWGTPQQQEPAFPLSTPYTGEFAGTSLGLNNKSMLYENSSICLPLEELNPVNITPSKKHEPDSSDSSPSQLNDRTNLANREHGLNSELLLNKKLLAVENTTQKSPDLKDASKTVVNSQVGSSSGASNSVQPSHKYQKGGFVGSWVKKLLIKNTSFMPSSASAPENERSCKTPSVQKISEVRLPAKGASNFGGFQSRGTKKTTKTPKLLAPQSNNTHPSSNFKGFSQSTCLPTANHTTDVGPTWNKSESTLGTSGKVTQFPSPGYNSGKAEESDSDKTKKLRLKLLKKLNAKKKKLASLDRLAVEQTKQERLTSGDVSTPSQTESKNDSELLQSFLWELQYQIDVTGNECGFNAGAVPGHDNTDEILAELLSPTSTVASLEAPKSEDECMYMEMVHSSVATAVPDESTSVPQAAGTSEHHNHHSPVKDTNSELDAINKHSVKKLSFGSPTRDDILEDLFSISAPSSMAGDIDLPHFDETLFETW